MSTESQPITVGEHTPSPFGDQPRKESIDADYLKEKEFETGADGTYTKKIPGTNHVLILNLDKHELWVKKGDAEPVIVSETVPGIGFLEGLWKTMTAQNL